MVGATLAHGLWVLSLCSGLSAVASQPASRPSPGQDIAGLIKQLDADRFEQREAATNRLREMGAPAGKALAEALDAGGLSPEAAERAKRLTAELYFPETGVVWHGLGKLKGGYPPVMVYPPEGIRYGDLLLAVNDQKVRCMADLRRLAHARDAYRLTLLRKGEGQSELTARVDVRVLDAFRAWPDEQNLYERFGHHGPWDANAQEGLRMVDMQDANSLTPLAAAWRAGCRDAMVLSAWLLALGQAGDIEQASKLAASEVEGAKDAYPDGRYRLGVLPSRVAWVHILAGRYAQADQVLDAAAGRAIDAKAGPRPMVDLRRRQLELRLLDSPEATMKFIRANCKELALSDLTELELAGIADTLAGGGDPALAVTMLDLAGDAPGADKLREEHQQQMKLAAEYKQRAKAGQRPVLVWRWEPEALFAPLDRTTLHYREPIPAPCRFEVEVRRTEVPARTPFIASGAGVELFGAGCGSCKLLLTRMGEALIRCGDNPQVKPWVPGDPPQSFRRPPDHRTPVLVGDVKGWHKVSVEAGAGVARAAVDGRILRTWYPQEPWPALVKPIFEASSGRAEFRNLKVYVLSDAPADNVRIEAAIVELQQAMTGGDLAKVRQRRDELAGLWSRVPEAAPYAERMRRVCKLYEAIFRPEGLALCSQDILRHPDATMIGQWTLEKDWLVVRNGPANGFLTFQLPLTTPDIEITGLIHTERPGRSTEALVLWNCDWTAWWSVEPDRGNTFLTYWAGEPTFSLGAHWDRMKMAKLEAGTPGDAIYPFCIRTRGDQVVVFIRDKAKPLLEFPGFPRRVRSFNLGALGLEQDTRVRFGRVVVRYLPKETRLDAPPDLPVAEAATSAPADK